MRFAITPLARPDWFVGHDVPDQWRRDFAGVPGLVWAKHLRGTWSVQLHRSHLPLAGDGGQLSPAAPHSVLRPYQSEALAFLKSRRGSLLGFEMRLGKTATTAFAHDPAYGALVVVGPLASRDVWRTWIERVYDVPPIVLQGRKDPDPLPGYPAYFIHYDILDAHLGLLGSQQIGTLVLDECHLLQSGKARRTQAATMVALRASRIIGLSGTPMWSRPISLYPILQMITPGAWGTRHAFGERYCDAQPGSHGWSYGGISHEEEFRARLGEVIFRRTWKDVVGDLPLTTRHVEPVAVSEKQVQEVQGLALDAALARGTSTVAGYLATLRRKIAGLKVKAAVESATQAMQDGHKVVIWTWHNEISEQIAALIEKGTGMSVGHFPVLRLRSEDNQTVRDDQVERFRAAPGPAAMVAGIAVGGVAIDLSCSDYAIFAEVDWTPANVIQAEFRTFAPTRPHVVVYLMADVDVERKLIESLGVREDMAARAGLAGSEIAKMVLG